MQDLDPATVASSVPAVAPAAASIGGVDPRVAAWAVSGAMALSGRAGRPPLGPPEPLVDGLERVGRALGVGALQLLGERAALLGLERQGDVSCGGATRLLRAADGWIAVTLSRADDVEAVPAWLELDVLDGDAWDAVAGAVPSRSCAELVERAALLAMPVAALPPAIELPPDPAFDGLPVRATAGGPSRRARRGGAAPLVVDLSSLWAGPLCGHLLQLSGARVVKVESRDRPDGARNGSPEFFDLLNGGKESVVLDFRAVEDVRALRRLLRAADVVIEASRPRALQQLGIDASGLLHDDDGPVVWLSITAYGREGLAAQRVGFGDDAAVAGGLVVYDDLGPCFCADAIADPITGMVAAAAVRNALASGQRWLIDAAMSRVAATFAGPTLPVDQTALASVAPPLARPITRRAAPLGRDTRSVLDLLRRDECAPTDL
jgi:crotonobetainyl-CoA:carnitine CoA-transferase CaiB-like acyl-CoA transferase